MSDNNGVNTVVNAASTVGNGVNAVGNVVLPEDRLARHEHLQSQALARNGGGRRGQASRPRHSANWWTWPTSRPAPRS